MAKRLLQAVILTILIKLLAATSSPGFSSIASARVSNVSRTSISLLYQLVDSMSDRFVEQFDHLID
jgi:hypothetical protein